MVQGQKQVVWLRSNKRSWTTLQGFTAATFGAAFNLQPENCWVVARKTRSWLHSSEIPCLPSELMVKRSKMKTQSNCCHLHSFGLGLMVRVRPGGQGFYARSGGVIGFEWQAVLLSHSCHLIYQIKTNQCSSNETRGKPMEGWFFFSLFMNTVVITVKPSPDSRRAVGVTLSSRGRRDKRDNNSSPLLARQAAESAALRKTLLYNGVWLWTEMAA